MSIERGLLTLSQWLSPAYPVGAFAYSHGLEDAVRSGAIASAEDLKDWLATILAHGSGRNDCILLRAAHGCEDSSELRNLHDLALAVAGSAERQLETRLQGAAFGRTTAAVWGGDDGEYAYPVAVGHAASRLGIDPTLTAALFLQAAMGNLVSAAMRLIPLGQTAGQRVIAALTPLCEETAQETAGADLDALQSTALFCDIAAMRHEALQPRIFRS